MLICGLSQYHGSCTGLKIKSMYFANDMLPTERFGCFFFINLECPEKSWMAEWLEQASQ